MNMNVIEKNSGRTFFKISGRTGEKCIKSFLTASYLMEEISTAKPVLIDDVLLMFPKIIQSDKITEETLGRIQQIYSNIQKEKNLAKSREIKERLGEKQIKNRDTTSSNLTNYHGGGYDDR